MIYAKIISFVNGAGQIVETICAKTVLSESDSGFQPYAVDSMDQLQLVSGAITPLTDAQKQAAVVKAAQDSQSTSISNACNAAIISGFTSSALGSAYTYPSGMEDQLNLSGEVLNAVINQTVAGWTTQFKCTDATGKTAYIAHTAAQMIKVGQDFAAFKLAQLTRNAQLQAEIESATTVSAVQAIAWG